MATIKDIAIASGVSVATVSRVINGSDRVSEDTKTKVQQAIKSLAYHPSAAAKSLGKRRSRLVGLVIPSLSDPLFMAVADTVEKKARDNNFQVLINPGSVDERRAIELMLERQCEALIVHSSELSSEVLVSFAQECDRFVLINRYIPEIAEQCVWLDNRAAGRSMAEYLIKQGHKQVALIMNERDSHERQERLLGIHEAFNDKGLKVSDAHIRYVEASLESGRTAMQGLLEQDRRFTAVMTQTDELAVGALSAAREAGLDVPRDVSVLGFGDTNLATASYPRLTTMRYPVAEISALATQLIFDGDSQDAISDSPSIPHRFHAIVTRRETVGPFAP